MYRVDLTNPRSTHDSERSLTCASLTDLAQEIDEATSCGKWTALEHAAEVAAGECFEWECPETGRVVEAWRVGEVVGAVV